MRLTLAAVGRLKAGPERELYEKYFSRANALGVSLGVSVLAREFDEGKARSVEERRAAEGRLLLDLAARGATLCALDERGVSLTSQAFASEIGRARDGGTPAFVVALGGPDGLDAEVRRAAQLCVAFGAQTWPHQLARVMAAEQIYRALSILAGHPYHRA